MSVSNLMLNEIDESGMTQCFNLYTSDFEDRFSGMEPIQSKLDGNWYLLMAKKERKQIKGS